MIYGEYPRGLQNYRNTSKLGACANSVYQALFLDLLPLREPGYEAILYLDQISVGP